MEFASLSLIALGNEMFFLAENTRGGFILMAILFYSAFVMSSAVYIEIKTDEYNDDNFSELCTLPGQCMFNMLRLTFLDGTGIFNITNELIYWVVC